MRVSGGQRQGGDEQRTVRGRDCGVAEITGRGNVRVAESADGAEQADGRVRSMLDYAG